MEYLEFELMTKKLLESQLRNSKVRARVEHGKSFKSLIGNTYKIDLSYEFMVSGVRYLTIVECKHWNRNVDREKVGYLKKVMEELNAQKCIIVTSKGYKSGAIKFAMTNGVGLLKIVNKKIQNVSYFDGEFSTMMETLESKEEPDLEKPIQLSGMFGPSESVLDFLARCYGKHLGKFLRNEYSLEMLGITNLKLDTRVRKELAALSEDWYDQYVATQSAGLGHILANAAELRIWNLQLHLLKMNAKV